MFQVTINGIKNTFAAEKTILQAARELGIDIPTLCHDERLKPYGGCRLCLVDVKGEARPVSACNTLLRPNMEIQTHTGAIESLRGSLLELLTQSYPQNAAEEFPEKEFHQILRTHGVATGLPAVSAVESNRRLRDSGYDMDHPYIAIDMSRCITCFRCVRICEEVQGQFAWRIESRGDATKIVPDKGGSLLHSSCVSCGACVDTCPSGALEDKLIVKAGVPEKWTKTTCPYCGVGCEMWVGTKNDKIIASKPVLESPVSKGHLCVKGRYAFGFVDHPDRVTEPMIRENGSWKTVSWDTAFAVIAQKLHNIISVHGPNTVGVLGSARATNEENYLAQKFSRAVLGTNNVDCCARVCHTPSAAALKHMLGAGAATNSFDDIERADMLLVVGSNATENHPIVGARIRQRALAGVPLVVIDPRKTELAEHATIHLALRPGTNVPLLNAMACVIISENLYAADFLNERVEGFAEFSAFIAAWTPERAAGICGVKTEDIYAAARLYAGEKPAPPARMPSVAARGQTHRVSSMCLHGLGVTEHTQGTEGVMNLINLALLTGNLGKPGAGVNPLRGQNNVQGSAHMGCDPSILTGSISLSDGKKIFEEVWGAPIPKQKGLNLLEMLDAAENGAFKALWVMGYDVLLSHPQTSVTRRAFSQLEFVVVQDLFLNETAKEFGTVFLPACSSFEKDGTFMNSERRIQRVRRALSARGNSKTDAEILVAMAKAMDQADKLSSSEAEDVWNEIRQVWPGSRGISYERIETAGIQWPCPDETHLGTPILHVEQFTREKKAALKPIDFKPTSEQVDGDHPFLLNTGRCLEHFNAGTMTMRTPNTVLRSGDFLDLSAGDAERLGLKEGDQAKLTSRWGEATIPVRVKNGIKPGECFATFHSAQTFLNQITGPHRDRHVMTPEYKITAVNIKKAAHE